MKNYLRLLMVVVGACLLSLSFAKEQTGKVSLEIQKDIQKNN